MKMQIYKSDAPWPLCKMTVIFIRIIILFSLPWWIYQALKEDKTFRDWWRTVTGSIK